MKKPDRLFQEDRTGRREDQGTEATWPSRTQTNRVISAPYPPRRNR
jgi:hypothetical protein